jgi:hypothetical protein
MKAAPAGLFSTLAAAAVSKTPLPLLMSSQPGAIAV